MVHRKKVLRDRDGNRTKFRENCPKNLCHTGIRRKRRTGMAIYKNTNKYFSAVDSRVILGRMLSYAALGVLTALLNRPASWKTRLSEITQSLALPLNEAAEILSELVQKGFAVKQHDSYGVYYDIYAYPKVLQTAPQGKAGTIASQTAPQKQTALPPGNDAARPPDACRPQERRAPAPECGDRRNEDPEWAALMEQVRTRFKPGPGYKSPYRN